MEAKRDLTPLYAILQGKEMDVSTHEPSQSQSLGEVFDHGTIFFLNFYRARSKSSNDNDSIIKFHKSYFHLNPCCDQVVVH